MCLPKEVSSPIFFVVTEETPPPQLQIQVTMNPNLCPAAETHTNWHHNWEAQPLPTGVWLCARNSESAHIYTHQRFIILVYSFKNNVTDTIFRT